MNGRERKGSLILPPFHVLGERSEFFIVFLKCKDNDILYGILNLLYIGLYIGCVICGIYVYIFGGSGPANVIEYCNSIGHQLVRFRILRL